MSLRGGGRGLRRRHPGPDLPAQGWRRSGPEASSSTAHPGPSARPRSSSRTHFGADVTAVCTTKNVELVRSLGADQVIDYTVEDYTHERRRRTTSIFDAVGKSVFSECRGSLVPGGQFITTDLGRHYQNVWLSASTRRGRNRVTMPIPKYRQADVLLLKELIEGGHYRAVIDRTYPLEHVVEATTYVDSEQKTGNVVLTLMSDDNGG